MAKTSRAEILNISSTLGKENHTIIAIYYMKHENLTGEGKTKVRKIESHFYAIFETFRNCNTLYKE